MAIEPKFSLNLL